MSKDSVSEGALVEAEAEAVIGIVLSHGDLTKSSTNHDTILSLMESDENHE